jgi:SNF2 family DNA or RNA helicase
MLNQEAFDLCEEIIADGCGLGKTIQMLAFLAISIRKDEVMP